MPTASSPTVRLKSTAHATGALTGKYTDGFYGVKPYCAASSNNKQRT